MSRSSLHEWPWGTRSGRSPAPSSHRGPSGSWSLHGTLGRIQPLPVQGPRGVSKDSPRHGQVGSLKAKCDHFDNTSLAKFWLPTATEISGAVSDQNFVVLLLRISPSNLFMRWFVKRSRWRYQMATFSTLHAVCAGNPSVTGEFSAQRTMARSFDVFFDLRLNKRLRKQSRPWWFEMPSRSLWLRCKIVLVHSRANFSAPHFLHTARPNDKFSTYNKTV